MNQMVILLSIVLSFTNVCSVLGQEAKQLQFGNAVVGILKEMKVPAKDSGTIVNLGGEPGQKVNAGDVIGQLDTSDLEAQRAVIQAERRLAEITAENDINIRFSRRSSEVSQKELDKSRRANVIYDETVSSTEIGRLELEAERACLLYTSPSPRDRQKSRMPSSA